MYFAIAIPLTFFTMACMYLWLRQREHRDGEKVRTDRPFDSSEANAEHEKQFVTDKEHGV